MNDFLTNQATTQTNKLRTPNSKPNDDIKYPKYQMPTHVLTCFN